MHSQTAAVSRPGGGWETQRQCKGQGNPCAAPCEFHAKKVPGSPSRCLRLGNRCLSLSPYGTLVSRHMSTVSAEFHQRPSSRGPQSCGLETLSVPPAVYLLIAKASQAHSRSRRSADKPGQARRVDLSLICSGENAQNHITRLPPSV